MPSKRSDQITVYPLPPNLPTSPYMDQLYNSMHDPDVDVRRVRPRYAVPALLFGRGRRVLHLHFFDELTQRRSHVQTAVRTVLFLTLLVLLRARCVKIVWTAHNVAPHETFYPLWGFLIYRYVTRWSNLIIAHSQAARATLESHYGVLPQCVVVPHGSYIGLYGSQRDRSASRAELGLPQAGPVWLNFGTLRPYKGLEDLIGAFARLPTHERGTLLIAGGAKDCAYAATIQQLAEHVEGARIEPHFIPDQQLPTYFAAADAIVLPYHHLLTSGVLLWALSYARPVIAPAFGPVCEIVADGEQGFLFAPGAPDALHAALVRALNHPALGDLGAAGFQVAQHFDWPTIAATTAAAYQSLFHTTQPS